MIRVVLADDQALVRGGFRALLDAQDDITVVGEAADGQEAVRLAATERPDVVLMDIRMPGVDGLEATRRIVGDEALSGTKVVILTTFDLDEYVFEAIRAGANGFLVKDTEPEELLRAVRAVLAGDALLSPRITRRLIEEFAARAKDPVDVPELGALTDREREVVALVGEGLTNDEIARAADHERCHGQDAREPRHGEAGRARPRPAGRLRLRERPRPPGLGGLAPGYSTGRSPTASSRPTTPPRAGRTMGPMTTEALSVTGLTKRYGDRTAVDHLDLEVPQGVVAGFVGPNGAGKTTTMAMLLGLVRPSAGVGSVLGHPITHPAAYLPRVGALIEHPAFYPSLSGAENLGVFATVGRHDPDRIPGLLELVGLDGRGDDRYRGYSLGMKQRLGIAAALLGEPELLILDEPANGLDPQGVREMRSLIGTLSGSGRTVLVSSHDLSELEQVCDWLVLIERGRSLYQGPTRDLLDGVSRGLAVMAAEAGDHRQLAQLLARGGHQVEIDDGRLVVDVGGADVRALAATVNRAAFDAGIVLAELSPLRTTLEDRYLSMVQGGAR